MNQELIILGIIVVVVVVGIIAFIDMKGKKMDAEKFDISVDALSPTSYKTVNEQTCPSEKCPYVNNTQYSGLNQEFNSFVTVKDYINTYEKHNDFSKQHTASVVANRYCQMLYPNHIEYFTGYRGNHGFGDCEMSAEAEIKKMFKPVKDLL